MGGGGQAIYMYVPLTRSTSPFHDYNSEPLMHNHKDSSVFLDHLKVQTENCYLGGEEGGSTQLLPSKIVVELNN